MDDDKTLSYDQHYLKSLSNLGDRAPILTVIGGQMAGHQFRLLKPSLTIGRAPESDVYLSDDGVSRHHAELSCVDGSYVISDQGSTNGTHVSGVKVGPTPVPLRDDDRLVLGPNAILAFHLADVLESEVQESIYKNSTTDALTGLFNRRLFSDLFNAEWAYSIRHRHDLSLISIDIDKFKRVNDTYGHPAGDAILAGFTKTLRQTIREEDIPGRLGGEEFSILLRRTNLVQGSILAERLRQNVAEALYAVPTADGEQNLQITISLGLISRAASDCQNPEEMMAHCDHALYQAKSGGRNQVVRFLKED